MSKWHVSTLTWRSQEKIYFGSCKNRYLSPVSSLSAGRSLTSVNQGKLSIYDSSMQFCRFLKLRIVLEWFFQEWMVIGKLDYDCKWHHEIFTWKLLLIEIEEIVYSLIFNNDIFKNNV